MQIQTMHSSIAKTLYIYVQACSQALHPPKVCSLQIAETFSGFGPDWVELIVQSAM